MAEEAVSQVLLDNGRDEDDDDLPSSPDRASQASDNDDLLSIASEIANQVQSASGESAGKKASVLGLPNAPLLAQILAEGLASSSGFRCSWLSLFVVWRRVLDWSLFQQGLSQDLEEEEDDEMEEEDQSKWLDKFSKFNTNDDDVDDSFDFSSILFGGKPPTPASGTAPFPPTWCIGLEED